MKLRLEKMMMAAALVALPLQAGAASPAPSPAQPYAMRGVRLGLTLDEFKAVAIPTDRNETQTQVWCSDQPLPKGLYFWRDAPKEMGTVVNCEWFSLEPRSFSSLSNHWVMLGTGLGIPSFRFVPSEGAWRLFEISITANNKYYPGIMDALQRNYGAGKTVIEPFQTRAGQSYDNAITAWDNGTSSIRMEQRSEQLDRYTLTYRHKSLMRLIDQAIEQNRAAAAGKI